MFLYWGHTFNIVNVCLCVAWFSRMYGGRTYREAVSYETVSVVFYRDVLVELVGTFIYVSVQSMLPLAWGDTRMGSSTQVRE